MSDDEVSDDEFDALVQAWLDTRQWLRCGQCTLVADSNYPPCPEFKLSAGVEGGTLVGVELTCEQCRDSASDGPATTTK